MKKASLRIVSSVFVVASLFGGLSTLTASAAGPNLISNPSFETGSGSTPADWSKKNYGVGSQFVPYTYPVTGVNGGKAAKVEIKLISLGLPVGWQSKSISVVAGHTYTFSDYSTGSIKSSVEVIYGGIGAQTHLGDVAANASFTQFTTTFKVPTGVTSLSILHSISKIGSLTVDEFNLTDNGAVADTIAPTVNVTSPTASQILANTVNLSANATDAGGVAGVKFYVDGNLIGAEDTIAAYSVSFDTKTITNAGHSVVAVARDTTGNRATSTPVAFTVNNPPAPTTGKLTVTLTVLNNNGGTSTASNFALFLNGKGIQNGVATTTAPGTFTLTQNGPTGYTSVIGGACAANGSVTIAAGDNKTCTVTEDDVAPVAPSTAKLTVTVTVTNNNTGAKTVADFPLFLNGTTIQSGVATTTGLGTFTVTESNTTGYTQTFGGACNASGQVTLAAGDVKTCTVNNDDIPPVVTPPDGPNLIANPSFETGTTGAPASWFQGGWGTNTAVYTYPISPAQDGTKAARVEISAYTDGDAKWYFNRVTGVAGKYYHFTDYYRSNAPTWVTVEYQMTDGTFTYQDIGLNLPAASTWTKFSANINAPAGATALTILHLIKQVGFLETDNFSLTEMPPDTFAQGMFSLAFDDSFEDQYDIAFPILNTAGIKGSFYIITENGNGINTDGQMTTAEVLDLQAKGHEVAAHTRTHPDLVTLTTAQATAEIAGSKQDLLNMGIANVDTFTYPYGSYNDQTIQLVKNAGFIGARSVNQGFNTPSTDKFVLYDYHLEANVTVASIKALIDQAIANKRWLILEAHAQALTDCGTEQYCNTKATLQAIVDYVKQTGIKTVTLSQGVKLMNP